MIEYEIMLNTIEKVKRFTSIVDTFENDIDLISGKYLVNGKSVMAIFSLDLMNPLKVVVHDVNLNEVSRIREVMEEFRVENNI